MKVKGVAMITRTLREGKTFDDYREAWYHAQGFGLPTTMLTVVNLHNPREIVSIGIMELEDIKQLAPALKIDVKERLSHPLDAVVEDKIERKFGVIVSEDDFSMAGEIPKKPTTVEGKEVKYSEVEEVLGIAARMFDQASAERDRLKRDRSRIPGVPGGQASDA